MSEKEWTVVWSDQVHEKAEGDSDLAEALREFGAIARQAMEGVQSGKYPSFEDAMFILTGERPELVDSFEVDETS